MTHPTIDELIEKLHAARRTSGGDHGTPEQVKLYRELVQACPAFAPALLDLGRWLQLTDPSEEELEKPFSEVQQVLERAVAASAREAPALVELGYFLDTVRDSPREAYKLYEEGAVRALASLEDAWAGMLRCLTFERTKESLEKALQLGELAERLFPHSDRIMDYVQAARQYAAREGLPTPDAP